MTAVVSFYRVQMNQLNAQQIDSATIMATDFVTHKAW